MPASNKAVAYAVLAITVSAVAILFINWLIATSLIELFTSYQGK